MIAYKRHARTRDSNLTSNPTKCFFADWLPFPFVKGKWRKKNAKRMHVCQCINETNSLRFFLLCLRLPLHLQQQKELI